MEAIRLIERMFQEHAPETLMAMFGAVASLLLFTLIWKILRHMFGLQLADVDQETDREQAIATLLTSLVQALVTEAVHLRETVDSVLRETLQVGQQNADALSELSTKSEDIPPEVLALLQPEFEYLHHEMRQAEGRIIDKLIEVAYGMQHKGGVGQSSDPHAPHEPEASAETGSQGEANNIEQKRVL